MYHIKLVVIYSCSFIIENQNLTVYFKLDIVVFMLNNK